MSVLGIYNKEGQQQCAATLKNRQYFLGLDNSLNPAIVSVREGYRYIQVRIKISEEYK